MHSYRDIKGNTAVYNPGFSGKVCLRNASGTPFDIDGQFLLELVAYGYVMPSKIRKLEGATAEELLD